MNPLRPLFLCCLLLSLPSYGADPSVPSASQIERLDITLTTLIQALEHVGGDAADAHTRNIVEHAQHQREKGLALALERDYAGAETVMNDALMGVKLKIAELRIHREAPAPAEETSDHRTQKHRKDLKHIDDSLTSLLDALQRIGDEKERGAMVTQIRAQVEQHRQTADALMAREALDAARRELDQALVTVKTGIAALRNQETLVRSLNFDSKEQEYHYELDRYETYAMLIQLLTEKQSQTPAVQTQMTAFQKDAQTQEEQARAAANAGDFDAAVKYQEISNGHLLKAIRRGGIYVPG